MDMETQSCVIFLTKQKHTRAVLKTQNDTHTHTYIYVCISRERERERRWGCCGQQKRLVLVEA